MVGDGRAARPADQAAIQADAQGLSERRGRRPPALVLTIDDRLAQNVEDDAIYLLVTRGATDRGQSAALAQGAAGTVAGTLLIERAGMRSLAACRDSTARRIPSAHGSRRPGPRPIAWLLTDALLWAILVVVAMARWVRSSCAACSAVRSRAFRRPPRRSRRRFFATGAAGGPGDEFDLLAETINDMLDRMARLMDGVREVSNAIAHDLRTPITRARARLEDAALHAANAAELRAAVERATADLDEIVGCSRRCCASRRSKRDRAASAFAELDFAVLAGVASCTGLRPRSAGIALRSQAPAHLLAYGDRELIQQAVVNLVDNAVKFSPAGGVVGLGRRRGRRGGNGGGGSGTGIPDPDREHAPQRFFRGETARNTPARGLGWRWCRRSAQLHGGSLRLSDASPGLLASLFFPARGGRVRRDRFVIRRTRAGEGLKST